MPTDQTANKTAVVLDKFPAMALPALFRAAIGAVNTTHYLKLFTRFETERRVGVSWNWAASLATFNWLLFRKLVLPLVAYLVTVVMLLIVVTGTGRLILHWAPAVDWAVWTVIAALLFGLPGFMGNALFYRQCRRNIECAIQVSPTLEGACQALNAQASTRAQLLRITFANFFVLAIAITLAFTLINRASDAEKSEDTAPTPVRQTSSAAAPTSAVGTANAGAPAVAAVVQAPPPAAPISTTVPPNTMASASPIALPTAAAVSMEYYINIGLFADPDNARRAYVKLVKARLPASREVMMVRQKRLTRVRSGPYDSRVKAQAAVARIKALRLDAVLAKP